MFNFQDLKIEDSLKADNNNINLLINNNNTTVNKNKQFNKIYYNNANLKTNVIGQQYTNSNIIYNFNNKKVSYLNTEADKSVKYQSINKHLIKLNKIFN